MSVLLLIARLLLSLHPRQVIVERHTASRRHSLDSRPCTPLGTSSQAGTAASNPRGRRTRRSSTGSEVEAAPPKRSASRSRSRSGSRSITRVRVSSQRVAQNTSRTPLSLMVASANANAAIATSGGLLQEILDRPRCLPQMHPDSR
jgi:hypothetical protein